MRSLWKHRLALLGGLWILVLVASRLAWRELPRADPGAGPGRLALELAPTDASGPLPGSRARLSVLHWPALAGGPARTPVVCLHGSPGSARNFEALGPRLAAGGRDVWALDLPGFGRSQGPVGGYSILAHAQSVLEALDALQLERAHLLGWSMGGGVALHGADLAPGRVASISLVGSIGAQQFEGSGSYLGEHAKYATLLGAIGALEWGLPHFGALRESTGAARAFALNFWETDQRPLDELLGRTRTPLLVVHGAGDVLIPLAAAEWTHARVADSRLVVLEANHFLPLLQVEELVDELDPFFRRHDGEPRPEVRARVDRQRTRGGWRMLDPDLFALGLAVPWWMQALLVGLAWRIRPRSVSLGLGLAVGATQLDFGWIALCVALAAVVEGSRGGWRAVWRGLWSGWAYFVVGVVLAGLAGAGWSRWIGPEGAALRGALGAALVLLALGASARSFATSKRPRAAAPARTPS